jgi:hypothetical protein
MEARIGQAQRIVAGAMLAVPNLLIGVWGVFAPRNWFDSFPGIGPALVAGELPFNAHLASDAAAGFLATGIALVWAIATSRRTDMRLALVSYLVLATPHVVYHASHDAPELSTQAQAMSTALLASGVIIAAALLVWIKTPAESDGREPVAPHS